MLLKMQRAFAVKGVTSVIKLYAKDGRPVAAAKRMSDKRLEGEGDEHLLVS